MSAALAPKAKPPPAKAAAPQKMTASAPRKPAAPPPPSADDAHMERIYAARRTNLDRIIREQFQNSRRHMSEATGVNANHLSLCLTPNPEHQRNVGEDVARKLERVLKLPEYAMDKPLGADTQLSHVTPASPIPPAVQRALTECEHFVSATLTKRFAAMLEGKISAFHNLFIASPATNEMAPEMKVGDKLLVDSGVREFTGDGYYILLKGDSSFIRRVTKSLSGGYALQTPNPAHESLTVPALSGSKGGYKVWGKVAAHSTLEVLL